MPKERAKSTPSGRPHASEIQSREIVLFDTVFMGHGFSLMNTDGEAAVEAAHVRAIPSVSKMLFSAVAFGCGQAAL
jgi:hypothetical protein